MFKHVLLGFIFLLCIGTVMAQKENEFLKLVTATQSNTTAQQRLRPETVKKGHDIYTFTFVAEDKCTVKADKVWIKDKTTIPITIESAEKTKVIRLQKGDKLVLKAEANGLFPYQKPPKKFNTAALITCWLNNELTYIEVKGLLQE